ncbi:ketosteroid isomerase-like protein [Paraburkholderia sp. GAS448]|uniref:nuclear transport factor 2 family protein n=1 Tax=Paraburkholderia sp. GAS448 TaxID=3035136 RepID=UPI003D198615
MGSQEKFRLAQQFLERLRSGAAPDEIASLCTPDLDWNVPGDPGALPWIGRKTGREAVSHFVRDARMMVEGIGFDIREVLASDDRAVILGHVRSRIKATGKLIDSEFAIVLTFAGAKIASFLLLEDSFAVSLAARH